MKQLTESQRKMISDYLDEKIKAEIHLSGVRLELDSMMKHSTEKGYPVEAGLVNWMPTVLRMTMQRQRALGKVMKDLHGKGMRDLMKGEVVGDYAPDAAIAPGLVESGGGENQDLHELFDEVGDTIIRRLDSLATMLRKTIGDLTGE